MGLLWDAISKIERGLDFTSQIDRTPIDKKSKIERDIDRDSRIIKVLNFESTKA